jgi:DNA-binding response OmpR family regulator
MVKADQIGTCMDTKSAPPGTNVLQNTPAAPPSCAATRPRILIVDDDPDALTILRYFLEGHEFEVLLAEDGTRAWGLVQECLPDLVITDYQMPEMNGMELARLMRSTERTSHIPILVHSAFDEMFNTGDALYDDWFNKPTDLGRLSETIRSRVAVRSGVRLA